MKRWSGWHGLGVFAAVALVYARAAQGQLLWNDPDYVTKPELRSWAGLGRIWFKLGATEQYYPVLHSAFWLEHRIWGDSAAGYHWLNIFWQGLAACLLAAVLRQLWAGTAGKLSGPSGERAAWIAALWFAVHPVEAESVAWISEQKNTLSLVFYLCAAFAYLRFDQARSPAAYAAACACYGLAILSKSVAATLPAAVLVALWWRRGVLEWRRDVAPLAPWFAAGGGIGLLTAWVERTYVGAQGSAFQLDFAQRGVLAGRIVWFYLGKLVWPARLIFFYPRWTIDTHSAAQSAGWLAAVLVTALLWRMRRRSRGPLAVWLFFVGSLFPTLGFFNVYAFVFSYVADHWQYLPSIGIMAGAAAGWELIGQKWALPAWGRWAPAFAVAALLAFLTWRQTRIYRDVETLYRDTIARNPDAWMAHSNLGTLLIAQGQADAAIEQYRTAIRLAPNYPEIHGNLADALRSKGEIAAALAEYREAIAVNPLYLAAQVNLATTLALSGQIDAAIAAFEAAVRLQPASAELRRNLSALCYQRANDLANAGRIAPATELYRRAVALQPDFAEARANLGLALATGGQAAAAVPELRQAIHLRPNYAEAHAYLGFALSRSGQPREAVEEYRTALRLNPRDTDTRAQLDALLAILGGR